jgi:hypothetical protein
MWNAMIVECHTLIVCGDTHCLVVCNMQYYKCMESADCNVESADFNVYIVLC